MSTIFSTNHHPRLPTPSQDLHAFQNQKINHLLNNLFLRLMAFSIMTAPYVLITSRNVQSQPRKKLKNPIIVVNLNRQCGISAAWTIINHIEEEEMINTKYPGDNWPLITPQETPNRKAQLENPKKEGRLQLRHPPSSLRKVIIQSKTEQFPVITPQAMN